MKNFHLITPGRTREQLQAETLRVFDICDGCRRCFNLCPSFNTLLDRIDERESDLSTLAACDFERVEQECYYCKLCYNHCPYTPPHQYQLDFPRLMAAWKKQRVSDRGASWNEKLLINTDLLGQIGSRTASLTNWALRTPRIRAILERLLGLHRHRHVLSFQKEPFMEWWRKRPDAHVCRSAHRKVVLFPSCLVKYQATEIGKASVQVLQKNGIDVVVPDGQQCCGMPSFDLGDADTMTAAAKHHAKLFQPWLDQGYDLVIPTPSCSLMFKREYPYLCQDDDVHRMSAKTFDICEYLMTLHKEGRLSQDFVANPGRVAYQIPCHLRDQNIGFKSKELMELTGAAVHVVERCSGHDGTWSAKVEFFELSMTIAKKAVRELTQSPANILASDCPLSALQLGQAMNGEVANPPRTLHPIQIVRNAYGITA